MENSLEKQIIKLFLFHHKLKFNEIEKQLKTRSNKIAYHIKNLVKKGIIIKQNKHYQLSETSESLIPYLSDKTSVLSVILISMSNPKNKNEIFLHKRAKRPFQDKLSLPGGRILTNESLNQGVKRILKKHNINASLNKINSVSLEHVKKNNKVLHSFLLILVTASTKDKIPFTNINKNKSKIINSDYKLLKQDLNKETKIKTFITLH